MHQSQARRICRWAFVLACVLPTLGVLALAVWWNLPSTRQAHFDQLEHLLGVRIVADHFSTPRPGHVRYVGVSLRDIESGTTLIACSQLDARVDQPTLQMRISGASIDQAASTWLTGVAQRLLASDWPQAVALEATGSEWLGTPVAHARLQLATDRNDATIVARRLSLGLKGVAEHGRGQCDIVRTRGTQAGTTLRLASDRLPLVGNWLASCDVPLPELDRSTEFSGALQWTSNVAGSSGDLTGTLVGLQGPLSDELTFTQLGLRFELSTSGLTVWGDRPTLPAGSIAVDGTTPVLMQPQCKELPVAVLASLVSPPTPYAVPTSREALDLVDRLPLPAAAVAERVEAPTTVLR